MIDIFPNLDDTKVVVARLISSGMSVQAIADFLFADVHSVYRLANQIRIEAEKGRRVRRVADGPRGKHRVKRVKLEILFPARKGRKVPAEKISEIRRMLLKTNLTPMEIARSLNMKSRSSIYRIRNAMLSKAKKKAGEFQPKEESVVRRCEKHGLVNVWPCVACEAEKYRSKVKN